MLCLIPLPCASSHKVVPLVGVEPTRYRYHGILRKMPKTLKKPSFNVLYILKFPRFFTTWRLEEITEDGYFLFRTSSNAITDKLNILRWNFIHSKFCVGEMPCPEIKPKTTIKITIESANAFKSKDYGKDELDNLIDDIDDFII